MEDQIIVNDYDPNLFNHRDTIPEDNEVSVSVIGHSGLLPTKQTPHLHPIKVDDFPPNDDNDNDNNFSVIEGEPPDIAIDEKENIYQRKFREWLCDEVKLKEYQQLFEREGEADVRRIADLTDDILKDIGIEKDTDRRLLLKEAKEFKKFQGEFADLLGRNEVCIRGLFTCVNYKVCTVMHKYIHNRF